MTITVRSNDPAADAKVNAPVNETEANTGSKKVESGDEKNSAPEANASEQNKSEESETAETEDKGTEEVDSGESDGDESTNDSDAKDESENKDKPKKKGGFQRRIDKLSAARAAAEQEAQYWRREAMKNATAPKTDAKVESKTDADADKPKPDSFETHAEYVEALTDWKVDQKEKAREQKEQRASFEAEQQKLIRTHTERVKAFSAKTEDFADVLSDVDDIPVSPAVREIILQADNGPELMYELAKNRDEYARICKLSPFAAAREMAKIESKITARTPEAPKSETKKITKAPKPLEPVGTGKGSTAKSISDPSLSQSDYEKLRREQLKRRRV